MRTTLVVLLAAGAGLLCLMSCEDGPLRGGWRPPSPPALLETVGMLWTYEVHDSLTAESDTVQLSVVDTARLTSGEPVVIVKCNFVDSVMTRYVAFSDGLLEVYDVTTAQHPIEIVRFPLTVGAVWAGPLFFDDTSRVTDSGFISVPAGDFDNGFRVDRSWMRDFEGGGKWSTTWIVPDVGFVLRHYLSQFSDGTTITVTVNQVWTLLEYNLSTFDIDRFPNRVGSEWVYRTYDSSTEQYDTLRVAITGTTEFAGRKATIWVYDYGNLVDTDYVVISGNRIEFYYDTVFSPLFGLPYYEFPLAVGRYWGIQTFAPIPEVLEKGPIEVAAGSFEFGFRHEAAGGGFNYYWLYNDWLVADVGLVFRTKRESNLGPFVTTTWELLSYSIP